MITLFPFFEGTVIVRQPCEIETPKITDIILQTRIEWIVTNTTEVAA